MAGSGNGNGKVEAGPFSGRGNGRVNKSRATKSAPLCSQQLSLPPELIHSNSQIYRVYTRSSANPTNEDIFITSAGKLTTLSVRVMTGGSMEGSGVRIDRIVFIDLVILSLSLTTFGLSCRSLLKFSTELLLRVARQEDVWMK